MNLYIYEGGKRSDIAKEADELFNTDTEPRVWFYSDNQPKLLSINLPHVLAVFGRPEEAILFGYALFFGGIQLIGVLNDNYKGRPIYFTHAVDPVTGVILKCDVNVGLNRKQLLSLVTEKAIKSSEISAQLKASESALRNNHYYMSLIDDVLQRTLLRSENRGRAITKELTGEIASEFVNALMPSIVAASKKRRHEAEIEFKGQIQKDTKSPDKKANSNKVDLTIKKGKM